MKFKGRLTDNGVTALNIYYVDAIRNNKDDIDGMVQAIGASLLHFMLTDEDSMHMKCPEHNPLIKLAGADLKLQPMRIQHLSHNPLIPSDLAKYVRPVYMRLANRELIERCTLGATQNQSESFFNNVIWLRASKTQFLGLPTVELATSTACLISIRAKKWA